MGLSLIQIFNLILKLFKSTKIIWISDIGYPLNFGTTRFWLNFFLWRSSVGYTHNLGNMADVARSIFLIEASRKVKPSKYNISHNEL